MSNPRRSPAVPAPSSEPEVRATPLEALGRDSTPLALHFRRNHFAYPATAGSWAVAVDGAVDSPLTLSLDELRRLATRQVMAVLECAGHRRAELRPRVPGVPWGAGAVSQARWTGVPLGVVLARVGRLASAVEVVLHGADGGGTAFARSISLAKALEPTTLLALAVEDGEIPRELGGPLRAIVPGHYAVDSVKWLRRVEVVAEPFRGHFQEDDYRFFGAAGVPEGTPLRELAVSSLVTHPTESARPTAGRLSVLGVAWGSAPIASVEVRAGRGPWRRAALGSPAGSHAFTPWSTEVDLDPGVHVLLARATDVLGNRQPDRPLWNERGYGNNSVHRVAVVVS